MYKVLLPLLIFYNTSAHTMLETSSLGNPSELQGTLYSISQDIFLNKIFPQDKKLNGLLSLIKKFGLKKYGYKQLNDQEHLKNLIQLLPTNILALIKLSQTNRYFYTMLNKEINNQLSHTSCNSIFTYFPYSIIDYFPIFTLFCNKSNHHISITIALSRNIMDGKGLYISNKENNSAFFSFCDSLKNRFDNQNIKNLCTTFITLQNSCNSMPPTFVQEIAALERALDGHYAHNYATQLHSYFLQALYSSYATLHCSTTLQLNICTSDNNILQNIEACILNNEGLLSIFSPQTSLSEEVLKYLIPIDSFWQTLNKTSLKKKDSNQLTFEIDCGFSDEPIIPIDIVLDGQQTIKEQ